MSFKIKNGKQQSLPQKKRLGNIATALLSDDVPTLGQVQSLISDSIGTTIEAANNTFTGTNTFSNTAGVTTDTITPATSGAGTQTKRPVVAVTGASVSPTKWNGVYSLAKADGIAVTLPAIATIDIGTVLTFPILTSCTSVGYVFTSAAGDAMIGGLYCTIAGGSAGANDSEFNIASGTNNTLTLGATTACGLAGGCVDFIAISATQWFVRGTLLGSGTIASNLFTTV